MNVKKGAGMELGLAKTQDAGTTIPHNWHPANINHHTPLSVDVLIPSFRASPDRLAQLFSAGQGIHGASVKFLVQIDHPHIAENAQTWLHLQQETMLHALKVRRNEANLGAGLTRNILLDNSHAEYVIMFDDDVVPTADTIQAYIVAFQAHPNAAGFAGKASIVNLLQMLHPMVWNSQCFNSFSALQKPDSGWCMTFGPESAWLVRWGQGKNCFAWPDATGRA